MSDKLLKLEKLYKRARDLEDAGAFAEAELIYLQALELDPDDHAGVSIRIASMGRGVTPRVAPPAYVSTLFDQHAEVFEHILVRQLSYSVPFKLAELLEELYKDRIFTNLLDLGCGTGLIGETLYEKTLHRTGVDLATNMVKVADEKGDYDSLFVGDIFNFLNSEMNLSWELITAADVLPYIGELEQFFALIKESLKPSGVFAFSTELLASELEHPHTIGFKVGGYQRYAHSRNYIEASLAQAGLYVKHREEIIIRNEQNNPIIGDIYIAELS